MDPPTATSATPAASVVTGAETIQGIAVGSVQQVSEPHTEAWYQRRSNAGRFNKGSILWLDSNAVLPPAELHALLTELNRQWPAIAQAENHEATSMQPPPAQPNPLFNEAMWVHIDTQLLSSALPGSTHHSDHRIKTGEAQTTAHAKPVGTKLRQRLRALLPVLVSAYAAARYNVLVDDDLSAPWYQLIAAAGLQGAVQPHIQLYIGTTQHDGTTDAQLPRHADLALTDLLNHQRIIEAARDISKSRFTVGRTCPLCEKLRAAPRALTSSTRTLVTAAAQAQIPGYIKGPSRCTYVLLSGGSSTYEYQRSVAQQLQHRLQPTSAEDADQTFLDMLALHAELGRACAVSSTDVDDAAAARRKAAFTQVVTQLGVRFSMTPAVLANAIISMNDCNNTNDTLLYALRSHTVLHVHIDSDSDGDATAWQEVQSLSTQGKVTGSMQVKQSDVSAEQAAAGIVDKLEQFRQDTMKTLDLSVHDTQRADSLDQQLPQLLAARHVVEDLYLGEMTTSGGTTAEQEQHRLDFLAILASCPQLKHLHVKIGGYNEALFTGDHLLQCLQLIARAPQLQLLMVDSWCTGDPGVVSQLESEYLQHFYDGVAGMRIKALEVFAVDLNKTMGQFVSLLQQHPTITQLALQQCDPTVKLLDKLAAWLRQPDCTLEHLTIWSASTGNEGARVLLEALAVNTSLRHLAYTSSGQNSDVLHAAGAALATNTTLQHLNLFHDYNMLGMTWNRQGENPITRYWKGEIADRVAFAKALEQSNHTLLSCDVFDGKAVRQPTGFSQTHRNFMVARRPEIPQDLAVLQRNQAQAGGTYVDNAVKFRAQAKSLEY